MKGKVTCSSCGWSWNKSDSSTKDMYICHECGRDNSNNMKNGGWLDGHSDTPKAQTGNKTLSSEYIDISKKYGIPQFTEEYINKAVELNKKYPGSKFVCDANGCADIASQAASGMGYDFGKANAWDYGNRSDILFTNPSYAEELKDPNGPLHNPTSYDVPKEFLGMQNVLIGLNRKNNLLNAEGKKVGNVPNAQQLAAAANKGEANDSYDYANQDLYEGSRGYEHVGYMLGNNNLLHGTAANKDHPAFFVIDDISDGVNLAGYGKYEPVEAIAEPTMVQTLTNKLKSLGTKAEKALFGESDKTTPPTFKKKKNGGWLESYADGGSMQEHQENYNDSKTSAPKGFKGDGYSNVGRNYSPAWGGQFQMGGNVYPVNYVPQAQMGASMPGAVGFTYARHGAPSKGPRRNQTDVTDASAQNGKDIHGSPITAIENYDPNVDRTHYDDRTNRMMLGNDYTGWIADENLQDTVKAHENYHAKQFDSGRYNYDIANNTDQRQWAEMQKRPQMMSTDEVWGNYYNRKREEINQDLQNIHEDHPELGFAPDELLVDKIVDREQYNNPYSMEGEASYYENTGKDFYKLQNGGEMSYYQHGLDWKPKGMENGGWLNKYEQAQKGYQTGDKPILGGGKYYTTDNKVVDWGTPEYEAAYNRGEVLSDDGVPSEVTLQGGVLPELVLQNNYKRGFWEQYRDKIIDENKDAGPLGAAVGVPLSAVTSLPQLAMMKGFTGEMQRPSEAIGFNNDEGVFANPISFGKHASNFLLDAVTDPANLIGAGVLTKENALSKLGKISTSIAPELRQGVNTNGFLDMFKFKKPTTSLAENTTNVSKNLEDLIHAKDWAKQYGYELPENLTRISQSDELTNRTIRGMMNRHNTFVRGVSTNWEHIAKVNPEILRHLEGKGIDWQNNPKAAAEYMSTHVPIQTGYGRAGLNSDVFDQGLDAIYTSNSITTAEGYTYGQGYITKVKKPTDFSSSNRKDWITQNSPEYYEGALERNKTKYFIGDKDVTGILGNFDSDMNTRRKFMDAQQSKNKMKEFKDNLLKEMEEDLEFYNRNPKFHGGNKEELLRNIEKVKNTDFSKIKINNNEGKKIAHKILKTEKASEEKTFKAFVDDIILNPQKNELIANDDAARKLSKEIYNKNTELYPSWKPEAEGIKNTKLFRQNFLNDIQNSDSDVLKKILETYTQKKDYAHYLHLGTPGEQILEPIKSWEITPDIWKNKSRAHTNTYSKKLSAMEEGGIIKDDMGQWAHPGEITEIGSNNITMQGVPYDVLGISDEGDTKLMKPGKNYKFKGKKVTEFPMANNGMRQEQKGLVNLDQLTNFTNYNKPQPGGWLNKYN